MRWKWSFLANIQNAVCGANLTLSSPQQTPSQQWSVGVAASCCGDACPQLGLWSQTKGQSNTREVEQKGEWSAAVRSQSSRESVPLFKMCPPTNLNNLEQICQAEGSNTFASSIFQFLLFKNDLLTNNTFWLWILPLWKFWFAIKLLSETNCASVVCNPHESCGF